MLILPPVPALVISIPSFILVIYVLVNGIENSLISYAAYFLSAYALIVLIMGMKGIAALGGCYFLLASMRFLYCIMSEDGRKIRWRNGRNTVSAELLWW